MWSTDLAEDAVNIGQVEQGIHRTDIMSRHCLNVTFSTSLSTSFQTYSPSYTRKSTVYIYPPSEVYNHHSNAAAAAKSLQSYLTLYDSIDGSPPGSPVPRILQARILEWVAISSLVHLKDTWLQKGDLQFKPVGCHVFPPTQKTCRTIAE